MFFLRLKLIEKSSVENQSNIDRQRSDAFSICFRSVSGG
jgi:hypothetical protein